MFASRLHRLANNFCVDDKIVISYFMPRHQTLKFSYNFKAKRYNVNLMIKNQSEPNPFNEVIEHDGKITLTPE